MTTDFEKIDKDYGIMTVECDTCGDTLEIEGTWHDCMTQIKHFDWKTFKYENTWINCCSNQCCIEFPK